MEGIFIRNLEKSFEKKKILQNVNLSVLNGDFHSIVGPSGTGKTTLLNIISGIQDFDRGNLDFTPERSFWEPVIQVFQNYMLFPGINIFQNVSYGFNSKVHINRIFPECRTSKETKAAIKELTYETLNHFGLSGLENKYPSQLSSGQQQRTAIARAVIIKPGLLLLDEPFANLDQNLKGETADFLRTVQKEYNLTTLAVTHDLNEAFAISDRISVMLEGEIKQTGESQEVYRNPVNHTVGAFLGPVNVFSRQMLDNCTAGSSGQEVHSDLKEILIRAEEIEALPDENGKAVVIKRRFHRQMILLELDFCGTTVKSLMLSSSLLPGDRAELKLSSLHCREYSKIYGEINHE